MNSIMFDRGFAAYTAGEPRDSNPYADLSEDYFAWAEGWESAYEQDLDCEIEVGFNSIQPRALPTQ